MGLFNDWKRKRNNSGQGGGFEFYEDTHDSSGEYVGFKDVDYTATKSMNQQKSKGMRDEFGKGGDAPYKLPGEEQYISPRNYQNVVVYKPESPEDVQNLIDFLKRREPAIVNLDDTDDLTAQRILDFISGAIYALCGSIHRVAGNIFLLSPEGVEITVPYERRDNKQQG